MQSGNATEPSRDRQPLRQDGAGQRRADHHRREAEAHVQGDLAQPTRVISRLSVLVSDFGVDFSLVHTPLAAVNGHAASHKTSLLRAAL